MCIRNLVLLSHFLFFHGLDLLIFLTIVTNVLIQGPCIFADLVTMGTDFVTWSRVDSQKVSLDRVTPTSLKVTKSAAIGGTAFGLGHYNILVDRITVHHHDLTCKRQRTVNNKILKILFKEA